MKNGLPIIFSAWTVVFFLVIRMEAKKCSHIAMKDCLEEWSLTVIVAYRDEFAIF